jgi:alkylation response protein AidB-like acyl-CoA dehydrogenase
MLRERADEIELARRLPADIARQFAQAGFFRMAVPRSVGGLELEPAAIMGTIESVAQADASAGWNVMVGSTSGMSAAYLAPAAAKAIYGNPLVITGGSNTPTGRAEVEGDGFRLSGRWPWVSGCNNCDWPGHLGRPRDSKPRLLPAARRRPDDGLPGQGPLTPGR